MFRIEKLAVINRQMIQGIEALWRELDEAGRAAGLDGDLILDHVAGYLQVAVDQGHYLDYYLTHKQDE
jgi:hypothetical protein